MADTRRQAVRQPRFHFRFDADAVEGGPVLEVDVVNSPPSTRGSMIPFALNAKAVTTVRTCAESDSSHTTSVDRICSGASVRRPSERGVVVQLVGIRRAERASIHQLQGGLFARQDDEAGPGRRVEPEPGNPIDAAADRPEQPRKEANFVLHVDAQVGARGVDVDHFAVDVAGRLVIPDLVADLGARRDHVHSRDAAPGGQLTGQRPGVRAVHEHPDAVRAVVAGIRAAVLIVVERDPGRGHQLRPIGPS